MVEPHAEQKVAYEGMGITTSEKKTVSMSRIKTINSSTQVSMGFYLTKQAEA